MKDKIVWRTEKRKVRDLLEYRGNPRTINDRQMKILQKSLKKFSLAEIPAINTDGTILAGNQRIRALSLLKKSDEEIDVRVPSRKLSQKEAEEYLLLSNRSGGDWNWEALQEFPPDLLMDLGFDESDLSRIWDETLEIIDDPFNEEKEIKKAKSTTIKIGDMFALGEHRIICGNSEDPEVIKKLLGDKKVDAVNSDIPFNLGLSYNRGMGHKKSYGGNINDKKTDSEYRDFVSKLMANALSVSKPNCHWAIWSDERYNGMIQDLYKEHGIAFKRTCLWVKPAMNPTPKVAFNKCVEYCTYGVTGLPYICDKIKNLNEIMNKDIGTGVRQTSDIIDLFNIWLVNRVPGQEMEHPTQKPPSLYEKFLKRTTRPGDAILDMTSGSGSLLLGCQQLGRKAFLCDITPTFIQLTIQRYEKLTGKKAEQIG